MKEKIEFVLSEFFTYEITECWVDDFSYNVRLNDYVVTSILFQRLIEQGFIFAINTRDCNDQSVVISFVKE